MKKILLLLCIGFISFVSAQNFQGQATYETKIKIDDEIKQRMDTTKMPDDRREFINKMMKKMMEKTYILEFDKSASLYKEEQVLEQPGQGGGRMWRGMNSEGIYFKDIKEAKFTQQKEMFGKVFLIQDDMEKLEWKLEKESKQIGNYLCFKATAKKLVAVKGVNRWKGWGRRGGKEKTEEERKKDEEKRKKDNEPKLMEVTAWYTPEIPVSQGPGDYYGLPGLILEVSEGNQIILCSKLVLNPKDKIEIAAPDKGKVVTQKEYDETFAEKMKEMREQFRSNRKKGDSRGGFRGGRR